MKVEKVLGARIETNVFKSKSTTSINSNSESLNFYKNFINDKISISDKAKKHVNEDKNLINFNQNISELEEMYKQLEETSNLKNHYMDLITCIKIAMRIIKGDKVPNKDKEFLAEKEPRMYTNAILLRRKNDKPKKYDRISEDEDDNTKIDTSSMTPRQGHSESSSGESISIDEIEIEL